ncbi:hypothetical protein GUJ93_ZPchr0006g41354 [Zizania palustris]|uniref:Uncharacterized protein n=1 Tax=Zizania palustris TaxID=103762 RepID=A0A8J5VM12_ZIZPA|nr:hypothetical protein GUJ93_ZPchr0006g41354 [Zizania palustris]
MRVRRAGGSARRVLRVPPRFVDSRSFAAVVADQAMDRFGGRKRAPDRGDGWARGGGRGSVDGGFRPHPRRDWGGRMGSNTQRDDNSSQFPGSENVDLGPGNNKTSVGDGQGKEDKQSSKGKEEDRRTIDGGEESDKDNENVNTAEGTKGKQKESVGDFDGDSDIGGKVDIPEYREDISEDENEKEDDRVEHLRDAWLTDRPFEQVNGASHNVNLVVLTDKGKNMSDRDPKWDVVHSDSVDQHMVISTDSPSVGLLDYQLPQKDVRSGKKGARKKKDPPIAKRFSTRIKRDGIPIQIKAQQRAGQLNDLTA